MGKVGEGRKSKVPPPRRKVELSDAPATSASAEEKAFAGGMRGPSGRDQVPGARDQVPGVKRELKR